jgi:hypothetical protein
MAGNPVPAPLLLGLSVDELGAAAPLVASPDGQETASG